MIVNFAAGDHESTQTICKMIQNFVCSLLYLYEMVTINIFVFVSVFQQLSVIFVNNSIINASRSVTHTHC